MTSKLAVATFPATSVAVTVSCVVPIGNVAPLPNGKTLTGPASPLRPSDADTLNVTVAPALDIAFVWIWNGYERSGAPLSIMIESACSASTLPFLSVA